MAAKKTLQFCFYVNDENTELFARSTKNARLLHNRLPAFSQKILLQALETKMGWIKPGSPRFGQESIQTKPHPLAERSALSFFPPGACAAHSPASARLFQRVEEALTSPCRRWKTLPLLHGNESTHL